MAEADSHTLRTRGWAVGTAVLGCAMLVIYMSLILSQEGDTLIDALPWALLMAIAAALAFASALVAEPRAARNLLIGAAVLFGGLGVVSLLTIGVGFLLTAAMAAVGVAKS